MSTSLPEMWPEEVRAEVRSPASILAEVAGGLSNRTRGLLRGEVRRSSADDGQTVLVFDIVVPALDNYRQRVLRLAFHESNIYPAYIDADAIKPTWKEVIQGSLPTDPTARGRKQKLSNQADSDTELIRLLQTVNQSLVPTLQSLIARANDALKAAEAEPRLRQIDDLVAATGYRYEPPFGTFVLVSATQADAKSPLEPSAFLQMLQGVTSAEIQSYLEWKNAQFEARFDQREPEENAGAPNTRG